jgi:hypothetical protein
MRLRPWDATGDFSKVYAASERGRLTNTHSKKIENLASALALHMVHYNFARIHQTLRVTPAMEAGFADHVWTIEEIVHLANCTSAAFPDFLTRRVLRRTIRTSVALHASYALDVLILDRRHGIHERMPRSRWAW